MGWFGCVLIGTLAKVQVFGGLRVGIGFCIFDCSLLFWLGLRPLWDGAWLWSLWAMKLVLENLYLIFFFFVFGESGKNTWIINFFLFGMF